MSDPTEEKTDYTANDMEVFLPFKVRQTKQNSAHSKLSRLSLKPLF